MFHIYRYFAIASALMISATMLVVGYIHHYMAVTNLVEISEKHNVAVANTLSSIIWDEFSEFLTNAPGPDQELLQNRPVVRDLDHVLAKFARSLSILKLKIYSVEGMVMYSTEHSNIGENRFDQPHNLVFESAAKDGKPQSKLSFEDRFSAFSAEVFNRDLVETYVPIMDGNGSIAGVLEIYSDVTETKTKIDEQVIVIIIGIFVAFLLLYGALLLVVMRRVVAPLRLASQRAASIGPRSPGVRLPTEGMAAELLPLIRAINAALDRMDRALDSQRQFTADAAHELLTPLAVLTASLDTSSDTAVSLEIRQDVGAMSRIVSQLLELAEFDVLDSQSAELVTLRDVCVEVVSAMAPVAANDDKKVVVTGSQRTIKSRCCSTALARALRNLVENAIAHTPAGSTVEVNLRDDGAVRVIDRGPGVPPAERELVFRRFWRGPERTGPGVGLGLSIVKRFVDAYGGEIEVGDAPTGGAVFTMRLPIAENA
jgi:signal transduction histidine kinase